MNGQWPSPNDQSMTNAQNLMTNDGGAPRTRHPEGGLPTEGSRDGVTRYSRPRSLVAALLGMTVVRRTDVLVIRFWALVIDWSLGLGHWALAIGPWPLGLPLSPIIRPMPPAAPFFALDSDGPQAMANDQAPMTNQ